MFIAIAFPSLSCPSEPPAPTWNVVPSLWPRMAKGNQEPGLPASARDRWVSPGTRKGRGKGDKCVSHSNQETAPQQSGSMRAQRPQSGLHKGTWPSKALGGWDPTALQRLGRSEVKSPSEEVPGQVTLLCKSEV